MRSIMLAGNDSIIGKFYRTKTHTCDLHCHGFENLCLTLESWNEPMVSQSHIIMKDLLICLRIEVQLAICVRVSTYYNWRASEASETLIGLNNGNRRYIYVYIVRETSL